MRNNLTPLRPGLTAIAAVMTLSATPAFAQSAETAQDAPVISAPAPIATAPSGDAAPAQQPAQQSVTSENTSAPIAEPAAPMATQSPVVIHTADAANAKATAAPKRAPTPVTRTATPAPVALTKAAPAPVAKAATSAPAPMAAPAPTPVATAPVATKSTTTATSTSNDDNRELELAGLGAVGLLALIGGAVAITRRKRDDEEEGAVLAPATVTTMPVEPIAYRAVDTAPVAATPVAIDGAPTTALHEDFDLSRYGAHVQTAYRGPTEDNPSLSLRHRLKRARFMDQRARENGNYVAATEPAIAAERKPIAQNLFGSKFKDGLRALRPQSGMRPAFS